MIANLIPYQSIGYQPNDPPSSHHPLFLQPVLPLRPILSLLAPSTLSLSSSHCLSFLSHQQKVCPVHVENNAGPRTDLIPFRASPEHRPAPLTQASQHCPDSGLTLHPYRSRVVRSGLFVPVSLPPRATLTDSFTAGPPSYPLDGPDARLDFWLPQCLVRCPSPSPHLVPS